MRLLRYCIVTTINYKMSSHLACMHEWQRRTCIFVYSVKSGTAQAVLAVPAPVYCVYCVHSTKDQVRSVLDK